MNLHSFLSFAEVAKAMQSPEDVIFRAWNDIQCSLEKGKGVRRECQEKRSNVACESAIECLRLMFASSDEFKNAVTQSTSLESMGMERKKLFHFASVWRTREQSAKTVADACDEISAHTHEVLEIYHGKGKSCRLLSKKQIQQERFKKRQRHS